MRPAKVACARGACREHDVGKRILVVDDEPQIRRIMRAVLVAKRYEITEAECGEDALSFISRPAPTFPKNLIR
jgi:CheY-like chemotaxis protein